MKRIYHPYYVWEDYLHGMYIPDSKLTESEIEEYTKKALTLLKDPVLFLRIGREMISSWTKAAEHNLTNTQRNRQAWIGQASSCYYAKSPEITTKYAWRLMTKEEQDAANAVANTLIFEWERKQN